MKRREFLIKSSMVGTGMMLSAATRAEATGSWPRYRRVTVIDALGDPRNGSFKGNVPLAASELSDVKASGITALNLTVGSVGSYAKDFEETLQNIAFWDDQITKHPDVLMKIKGSSDLAEAKRGGRRRSAFSADVFDRHGSSRRRERDPVRSDFPRPGYFVDGR